MLCFILCMCIIMLREAITFVLPSISILITQVNHLYFLLWASSSHCMNWILFCTYVLLSYFIITCIFLQDVGIKLEEQKDECISQLKENEMWVLEYYGCLLVRDLRIAHLSITTAAFFLLHLAINWDSLEVF